MDISTSDDASSKFFPCSAPTTMTTDQKLDRIIELLERIAQHYPPPMGWQQTFGTPARPTWPVDPFGQPVPYATSVVVRCSDE